MADDFRMLAIRQGASMATGLLSSRVRTRTERVQLEERPDPERPAMKAAEQLVGRRATVEGSETIEETELVTGPMLVPDELFDSIEDREEPKAALRDALSSPRPVHVLLVGDPGSAKTELLRCVTKLPQSRYATGGSTTSAGLVSYLMERPSTRIVVIDELDKADKADLYQLYTLMQTGEVVRLQHNAHEQLRREVWVLAAANDASKLPQALLSRFVIVTIPSYSPQQMREITEAILVKREGVAPARAREIARAVALRSKDPRDAVQIARMAGATGPIAPVLERVLPRRAAGR